MLPLAVAALAIVLWCDGRCRLAAMRRGLASERRAQRDAQREFVRRLAHELGNLATVLQVSLLAAREVGGSVPPVEAVPTAAAERLAQLAALARTLGQLARVAVSPERRAPVALATIAAEALELARAAPGRQEFADGVAVLANDHPTCLVDGDAELLVLAVYQLIDNAYTFAAPYGRLTIAIRADGRWAAIEVADEGPGIPPEHLPHVAEPLYRVDTAMHPRGLGLGLTLATWIAEAHGGRLVLDSRPGAGTVAALHLPCHHDGAAARGLRLRAVVAAGFRRAAAGCRNLALAARGALWP